jgi:flagellin
MTVINTNVASLRTQAALAQNSRSLQSAMEQLSTGKRINSAADDAAGLAISTRLGSQINGLNQAIRNANDGISWLQTADSATSTVTSMLQRMQELAVQASNGTYSTADKTSMNTEYQQLYKEIKRVASTTTWGSGGSNMLDGTYHNGAGISFQIGATSSSANTLTVSIGSFNPSGSNIITGMSGIAGKTVSSAGIIAALTAAMSGVNTVRSNLGAYINRLQFTVDNLTNISTNVAASQSQITDVDYAQATSALAKTQVIQQAATAMLAQANQQPQLVLSLLK